MEFKKTIGVALRGGGVRASVQAGFLAELFATYPDIRKRVGVWGGTSAGAILALMYASGRFTPSEIPRYCASTSKAVFQSRRWFDALIPDEFRYANYSIDKLADAMKDIFGSAATLGGLETDVAIITTDLLTDPNSPWGKAARPVCMTRESHPHVHLWEAATRSCAAPTYFPSFQGYVDGGVAQNNPALYVLAEMSKIAQFPKILDIGNGAATFFKKGDRLDWGSVRWLRKGLIDMILDQQCRSTGDIAASLLGSQYLLVDCTLEKTVKLDDVSAIDLCENKGRSLGVSEGNIVLAWSEVQHGRV